MFFDQGGKGHPGGCASIIAPEPCDRCDKLSLVARTTTSSLENKEHMNMDIQRWQQPIMQDESVS